MKALFFLLFCLPITINAQFPQGWTGNYSGIMLISNQSGRTDTVDVDLSIQTLKVDSLWSYVMTYHSLSFGTVEKSYSIFKDKNNRLLMDEGDSLYLDMTYMNGCLYSFYELNNTYFSSTMRLDEEGILFDLFGGQRIIAHNKVVEEGYVSYSVDSYRPEFAQTALLKRIP
jgi:hypothetical protein